MVMCCDTTRPAVVATSIAQSRWGQLDCKHCSPRIIPIPLALFSFSASDTAYHVLHRVPSRAIAIADNQTLRPLTGLASCYDVDTETTCVPPAKWSASPRLTVCALPLTTTLPATGTRTIPDVPSGTSMLSVKLCFCEDHLTPNQPRGVVNPPSAAESPDRCGATCHVRP